VDRDGSVLPGEVRLFLAVWRRCTGGQLAPKKLCSANN
jgi:hypothetical protein